MQQLGWGSYGHYAECEKNSASKDYMLCDSIYMTFWKTQNWEQIRGLGMGSGFDYKEPHDATFWW